MVKSCIRKLKKCLKKDVLVKFQDTIFHQQNIMLHQYQRSNTQSNVVYELKCPGCHANHVGKTERTIWERTHEHGGSQRDKPIYQHYCDFQYLLTISKYLFTKNNLIQLENDKDFLIKTVNQILKLLIKCLDGIYY